MKRLTQIWVEPIFKKKIKKMAIDRNMSLADLSRELAGSEDMLAEFKNEKKEKFRFKI